MLQLTKIVRYIAIFVICLTAGLATAAPPALTDEPFLNQFGSNSSQSSASTYTSLDSIPCVDGTAGEFPCHNVDLVSFLPISEMGITDVQLVELGLGPTTTVQTIDAADIWGWTDPETGDEYAVHTLTAGTSFIRMSDPENPVALGFLPTQTEVSNWRDVKVYENHAFIVSEAPFHGLQVFDLTQLREITATTSISPTNIFTPTAHMISFGSSHNIAINEESGFAYVVGAGTVIGSRSVCDGGLHFIDISDPANPTNSGCFAADGYTHDVQCVNYNGPDSDYEGKEICLASNEDTLTIVDVTDKSTPVQISRTEYDNSEYTHQGWLTEDHTYFLLNDELDEQRNGVYTQTYFWNVADLDAPFIDNIYTNKILSIDHNLYTHNNSAFLSNYTSGLRILGISDPTEPVEIGYFDVHPDNDNPNFQGTWSNYPYFDSGNIIVSSIERGLFIVRPQSFSITAPQLVTSCDDLPATATLRHHAFFDANDLITLSASGTPTTTFTTSTMLPGEEQIVTFIPTGSSDVDVVIEGANGTETAKTTITFVQAPPPATTLLSPLPQTTIASQSATFRWEPLTTATSYHLEISSDAAFNNIVYESVVAREFHTAINLPQNALLHWRVTAINDCGSSPITEVRSLASIPLVPQCTIVYSNDFEIDSLNWSTSTIQSDVNTWALGASGAYSSTVGWSVNDLPSAGQTVSSPIITLSDNIFQTANLESITLRLWHKRDLADDDIALLLVNVSRMPDPPITLSNALYSEPYNALSPLWDAGPPDNRVAVEGWSGTQDWTELTVDLTEWLFNRIYFTYYLFSGETDSGAEAIFAIDDVSIEICRNYLQPADFNSGESSYGLAWHGGEGEQRLGVDWDGETTSESDTDTASLDPELVNNTEITEIVINEANELVIEAAQDGWVRGWFDWNEDGQYVIEELAIDQAVVSGTNIIEVTPPADTVETTVGYRIRISTDSSEPIWDAVGFVSDGEVEDGTVNIVLLPTAVTAVAFRQMVNVTPLHTVIIAALVMIIVTAILPLRKS